MEWNSILLYKYMGIASLADYGRAVMHISGGSVNKHINIPVKYYVILLWKQNNLISSVQD